LQLVGFGTGFFFIAVPASFTTSPCPPLPAYGTGPACGTGTKERVLEQVLMAFDALNIFAVSIFTLLQASGMHYIISITFSTDSSTLQDEDNALPKYLIPFI